MPQAATDRLMNMCQKQAAQIAEQWYKALGENERTASFSVVPKEAAIRHAVAIFKNIGPMYFADNAYKAVEHMLNVEGIVEDCYARSIPLEQLLYALILLRRYIWLTAERQAVFELSLNDIYEEVQGINRVLLIFDYISYIAARRYRELSTKKGR